MAAASMDDAEEPLQNLIHITSILENFMMQPSILPTEPLEILDNYNKISRNGGVKNNP